MVGPNLDPDDIATSPEEHTNTIFEVVDVNKDGKLSSEEFIDGAYADPFLLKILDQTKF